MNRATARLGIFRGFLWLTGCVISAQTAFAGTTTVTSGPVNYAREVSVSGGIYTLPAKSITRTVESVRSTSQDFFLILSLSDGAKFAAGGLPDPADVSLTTPAGGSAAFSIVSGGTDGSSAVTFLVDVTVSLTGFPTLSVDVTGWKIRDDSNKIATEGSISVTIKTRDSSTNEEFDPGVDTATLIQGAYGVATPEVSSTTAVINVLGGRVGFVATPPDTEIHDNGAKLNLRYTKDALYPDGSAYALVAADMIRVTIAGDLMGVKTIVWNPTSSGGAELLIDPVTEEEVTAGSTNFVVTDTNLASLANGPRDIRIIVDGTSMLTPRILSISVYITYSGGASGSATNSRDLITSTTLTTWSYSQNPIPSISSISPSTTPAGSPGFTLTVIGKNFISGSKIRWNGSDRTTTFVSTTQLTASIQASDVASGGTASVNVSSPPPGGGISNSLTFTIASVSPTLTSISPSSATAGSAQLTLTLNGSNFVSGSKAKWNGSDRTTTFLTASQLTAVITEADLATAGTAQVTVSNPLSGTSNALTFTINNPLPTLTSVSPTNAVAGGVAFTLTANGTGFVSASTVRWNGNTRTTTFVSATQLTAEIPAADIATIGTTSVTVFNPTPGGGASTALTFTISAAQPSLEITMSKASYVTGDTVTATEFRFKNPKTTSAAIEVKTWLELPGMAPLAIINLGSDGSFSLPSGHDTNLGPLQLFTVSSSTATGNYSLSSRVLDPVTGATLSEDLNSFTIGTAAEGGQETDFIPSADITMSAATYGSGDAVTASTLLLKNSGTASGKIEIKAWLARPTGNPSSFLNLGADGSLTIPGNLNAALGPITLFTVASTTEKGEYTFNIRLVDPTTGKQLSVDLNPFTVQ